jgi:hypothetical protein
VAPLLEKELQEGKVLLGLYNNFNAPKTGPYEVSFTDVKIWEL